MKLKYTAGAAAAALLLGAPTFALADCDANLRAYDKQYMEMDAAKRPIVGGEARRDVRELRNAAIILQRYGKDDACEDVIAAAQDIATNPETRADAKSKEMVYAERVRKGAENAVPLKQGAANLTASTLMGADLHSTRGEDLGEVSDVVLNAEGGSSYLVVSHGGFLGMGDKEIAIPFDSAKISRDGDIVYVNMTEEQLEKAPSFEPRDREWLEDASWREKNAAFFRSDADMKVEQEKTAPKKN